ncbi:hypothetical protein N7448_007610 [Penicillium atrosanguineum]|uniref:Uncharacterized protein n=1 Tax=Penicillium atrosanguineum TaxID=1132637 RepID=A0A9W9GQ07_9EURO|nr:RAVE complex protein Rav1 C-terminal [Penicillium atrosanguineum]KAJ5126831.1 hypothetical protein N7448_007610 [Penicillium atrosanguineum]KAJ5147038.1 hypothetical protein N7526_000390 [Penicillium atrosanguineum]KAJ5314481.1 RAVE complex protein Rav1 C-terminal [Penicillium atrosanguineum]KAJ5331651.1 hypothetical protein N7476_001434 [Penicillium atrosanguineum]
MQPEPAFHIELFTSTELLAQPWLRDLTRMINDSYLVSHTDIVQFDAGKIRLKTDTRLSEELGSDGFTAVAFENSEVIGTASMKPWKDDGLWKPFDHFATDDVEEQINDKIDQTLNENALPGDYELALVALPPGPRFRGRGIAGRLVKACEEEVLRRRKATEDSGSVGIMIRVVKENVGNYWLKQGFTPIGKQPGPEAWEASMPFTMWAMVKYLQSETVAV